MNIGRSTLEVQEWRVDQDNGGKEMIKDMVCRNKGLALDLSLP